MIVHTEVVRHGNENVLGMMRRFTRKAQGSGVVKRVRSLRYHGRALSAARKKLDALTRIKRTEEYLALYKLGREPQTKKKRR
ncbi:MAG: 30S ribosomal protein S21 [Candidatus Pacebacteria bacterium]|nr:30S ribosomal protein S21 [Candidatus Paceibacterota bacterium]